LIIKSFKLISQPTTQGSLRTFRIALTGSIRSTRSSVYIQCWETTARKNSVLRYVQKFQENQKINDMQ